MCTHALMLPLALLLSAEPTAVPANDTTMSLALLSLLLVGVALLLRWALHTLE